MDAPRHPGDRALWRLTLDARADRQATVLSTASDAAVAAGKAVTVVTCVASW
jgi:hypothetical protein